MSNMRAEAAASYREKMGRMGLAEGDGRGQKISTAAMGEDVGIGHAGPEKDGSMGMAQGSYAEGYGSAAENEATMRRKSPRLDRPAFKKGGRVGRAMGGTFTQSTEPLKRQPSSAGSTLSAALGMTPTNKLPPNFNANRARSAPVIPPMVQRERKGAPAMGRSTRAPVARKDGGEVKGFKKGGRVAATNINIIVSQPKPQLPLPPPGLMPPPGPPPMPPGPSEAGPPMPPGGPLPGVPMGRNMGGRVSSKPPKMKAGAGGGKGRLAKIKAYGDSAKE